MTNWRTTPGGSSSDTKEGLNGLFIFIGIILLVIFFIFKWIFKEIKSIFSKS